MRPGDTWHVTFALSGAATGTPTAKLLHNGVNDATVTPTVAAGADPNTWLITATIPATGYAAADTLEFSATATVSGTTSSNIVARAYIDLQTGDAFGRIGVNGAGLTALGDARLNPLNGYPVAQAGTSTTITLAATSGTDVVGQQIVILGGTGTDQARTITAVNTSTRVATVDTPWSITPDTTSVYALSPSGGGWLAVAGALEPGETGAQTLRAIRSESIGKWDTTTNPGFATFFRKDGTTEAFRVPVPTGTGRATPTLGGGL